MNVTIIEDDNSQSYQLKKVLQSWASSRSTVLSVSVISSGKEFISAEHHINAPAVDLYILDIELDEYSGLDIAHYLRSNGYKGFIIFLTAYREFVFEGYNVHALNYLLKPIDKKLLYSCMDEILSSSKNELYTFTVNKSVISIPYNDILCFSTSMHYVDIMTESKTYVQHATLNEIVDHLPSYFLRAHRSYVINMRHIRKISSNKITLSNRTTIPIGRTYYNNVCTYFADFTQRFSDRDYNDT